MKKNTGYKILAVIITILIWLQIGLLTDQTTVISVPLHLVNISDDLYLIGVNDLKIPLHIRGRGINIFTFYFSDPKITYNSEQFVLGNNALDFSMLEQSLPTHPNLRFSLIQKEIQITITTDTITQKRVPVTYDFASELDRQTLIQNDFLFDETYVTISGPGYEIQNIDEVFTEKLKVDILKQRTPDVRLKSVNENVIIIPALISLSKINDMIASKTLPFIPINHDEQVMIFPQRVTVKIEGKPDSLAQVSPDDITAFVTFDGNTDDTDIEISFQIPDHIKIIDYTPKTVNMRKN